MTGESVEGRRRSRVRWATLGQVQKLLEVPLLLLSFAWVMLLVADFTVGLSPPLQTLSTVIWVIFGVDFALEFVVAPAKGAYLRKHWITVISLLLPAFRVLRAVRVVRGLRVLRAVRSVNLLRVLTSLNRGMTALGRTLGRSGFGYVLTVTVLVALVGAAGMYLFEKPQALRESGVADARGLASYGEALWWVAMLLTTMGSDYWPRTVEGRILCWMLALYAFGIFGYITAAIAKHLIGPLPTPAGDEAGDRTRFEADVRAELSGLHQALEALQGSRGGQVPADSQQPEGDIRSKPCS